jgi:hypothetical protein
MTRIPDNGNDSNTATASRASRYAPHNEPALHLGKGGRSNRPDTVVGYEMAWRGMRQARVAGELRCSQRALHNYLTRTRPFPSVLLAALCDLFEMDDDELVDETHYLRRLEFDERGLPITRRRRP